MKENEGLRLNDQALRLFFEKDTLYSGGDIQASDSFPSIEEDPIENPATPEFEGGENARILFLFEHAGKQAMEEPWKKIILGLTFNEKAMNLKEEELAFINCSLQPEWSIEMYFGHFPNLKQVLVWGNHIHANIIPDTLYQFKMHGKIRIHKLDSPEVYMASDAKVNLWNYIKSNVLN
ncbi:MAG: hypothetical protein GC180_04100 [Bacteroidetes bacterium]|nr:hypothetical protein [Bacteroidota bacterium]